MSTTKPITSHARRWTDSFHEPRAYLCCRDHDRGPGAWAVRGPHLENLIVPDRSLGEAIACLLSGDTKNAEHFEAVWRRHSGQ